MARPLRVHVTESPHQFGWRLVPSPWRRRGRPAGVRGDGLAAAVKEPRPDRAERSCTLSGWLYGYARVLLTVGEDGTAEGRLLPGTVSARAHAAPAFGNPDQSARTDDV